MEPGPHRRRRVPGGRRGADPEAGTTGHRGPDPEARLADAARAWVHLLDGNLDAARVILRKNLASIVPDPEILFEEGVDYYWAGEIDTARELFARAVAGGFYCYPAFVNDRRLADLNQRPEFGPILEKAQRRYEEFLSFVQNAER